jgi:hypothetical protein
VLLHPAANSAITASDSVLLIIAGFMGFPSLGLTKVADAIKQIDVARVGTRYVA